MVAGAFLACVAALVAAGVVVTTPFRDVAASVLYVRNYVGRGHETAHLWSLSLEEQFYLIWPAALLFTPARWRRRMVVAGILGVCAWRSLLIAIHRVNVGALYNHTDLRLDTLLLGCALALYAGSEWHARLQRTAAARPFAVVPLTLALLAWGYHAVWFPHGGYVETPALALLIVLLVNWSLTNRGSLAGRVLEARPMLVVGRLSYSIYLWQQLFLGPFGSPLDRVRVFPWNVLLLGATAVSLYLLVERPFLRLKDRVGARRPVQVASIA